MQKRSRGRPPLETPRQLLVAVGRVMLERKVTRWRAACIVASSREGKSFYTSRTIAEDSLSRRLNDAFARDAKSLLAAAGRSLEFQRRYDAAVAEFQAARSRGETPRWMEVTGALTAHMTPGMKAALEAMERQTRTGLASFVAVTQEERAIEKAKQAEREWHSWGERLTAAHHSGLFTSMRTK